MIRKTWFLLLLGAGGLLLGGCGSDSSGQSALREGMAAFNEKNYAAAITHLTRATQRITSSADLYYHLGCAHLEKGEPEPAAAAFIAALELNPKHGESLAGLGQVAFYKKDLSKARDYFRQALASTVSSDDAKASILNGLALAEAGLQRYDLARLYLLEAQQASPKYAPSLYNLASLYRDTYNLREEALDQFEMYVRIADKKDPYLDKGANNVKRLRLNMERTRGEEMDALRRDPEAAAKLLHEGIAAHSSKQFAKAIKCYRDALAADPLAFNAAFGMGMVYKRQGQRAESMEAFKRAAAINPCHQDSYLQSAELAVQLKRYDEAEKILDRAIARSPYSPASAELMVRIRHAESRLPEARAYGEFYLSLLRGDEKKNSAAFEAWVKKLPTK